MQSAYDWGEACEEIAGIFPAIESELNAYVAKHGAVLDKRTKELLGQCSGLAGEHKFGVHKGDVEYDAVKAAGKMYENLEQAERTLLDKVHSQAIT